MCQPGNVFPTKTNDGGENLSAIQTSNIIQVYPQVTQHNGEETLLWLLPAPPLPPPFFPGIYLSQTVSMQRYKKHFRDPCGDSAMSPEPPEEGDGFSDNTGS